jgi:hypothetical protein
MYNVVQYSLVVTLARTHDLARILWLVRLWTAATAARLGTLTSQSDAFCRDLNNREFNSQKKGNSSIASLTFPTDSTLFLYNF